MPPHFFASLARMPLVSEGIRTLMQSRTNFHLIRQFDSSIELLKWNPVNVPDTIIIGPCIEVNKDYYTALSRTFPLSKFILIQKIETCQRLSQLLKLKPVGLLLDSAHIQEYHHCLNEVIVGKKYLCTGVKKKLTNQDMKNFGKMKTLLTRREKEVLELIVAEYTTKEIAKMLYISSCTAETHRLNIIHKLGVRNTAGIVREALRNQLF